MTSIFIWKSEKVNNSKKMIRIYSGSNWILEELDNLSRSYKFSEQYVIPRLDNAIITYYTEYMPSDWIGTYLLEVVELPYLFIKSDNYGTLEQIGQWLRFTPSPNTHIDFNKKSLELESDNIMKWVCALSNRLEYNANNISKNTSRYRHNIRNIDNNKDNKDKHTFRPPLIYNERGHRSMRNKK
jgi:hypothetical protein